MSSDPFDDFESEEEEEKQDQSSSVGTSGSDPVTKLTVDLREVADRITDLLVQVEALNCKELEPEEITDVGQVLWDLSTNTTNALKPLKSALRRIAIERWGHDPGPRYFTGYRGSECVVTVPNPTLRVRPGADMDKLRDTLGDPAFKDHFDTSYKPRKTFRDRVASCSDKGQQTSLLGVVDEVEGTPRVSFKVR